ncbi:hypothetical protein ACQ4PT_026160 [Festuca glaucescens]
MAGCSRRPDGMDAGEEHGHWSFAQPLEDPCDIDEASEDGMDADEQDDDGDLRNEDCGDPETGDEEHRDEDDTTASEGDGNELTNDGQDTKRDQRNRIKNKVPTGRLNITRLDAAGVPVSPFKESQGYDNTLGFILRETCTINESNIRACDKASLRRILIAKVHQRYEFPKPYNDANQLNNLLDQYKDSNISQESSFRWDMPLNRALNTIQQKDLLTAPAGGRVAGFGTSAPWKVYYPKNEIKAKDRKKSNKLDSLE